MSGFSQEGGSRQAGEAAADNDQIFGSQGAMFSDGRSALSGVYGRSECDS
jgi:hypothetical protein